MTSPDLTRLFASLLAPMPATSGNDLSAVPFPSAPTHRLGKDANGSPCLLIRQTAQAARSAPIRLENLFVSFDVPCTVRQPNGVQESDNFTIVRCTAGNPALFPHFLKIVSSIIAALGPAPTQAAVRRAISGLVELFQALSAPAKKTIQGLWAELLIIRLSTDPVAVASAWHRDPVEHFDFAAGPERLEVKSSSARRREHYFSLDQLTPVSGIRIVVASIFVERVGGGVSLRKISDDIRAILAFDPARVARFDSVVYGSIGSGWADALEESFDWELARESIAFYAAQNVPRPNIPAPQAVFDVRFRSDLTFIEPLAHEQLQSFGGIFAAAVPS